MDRSVKKVLIIRFSSFGDINQCLFAAESLRQTYPDCQIDWLTRSDFASYLREFTSIEHVYGLDRTQGLKGLVKLAYRLRQQNYDLVYDAHNNLRSSFVKLCLGWPFSRKIITRGKDRLKRLLLFQFRINRFPRPFKGADSYLNPLTNWIQSKQNIAIPQLRSLPETTHSDYTVLAPAAAWALKQWSLEQWKSYLQNTPGSFVILGGPADTWLAEMAKAFPDRVENLAGQLSWVESLYKVAGATKVIGVDTGITHLGDLLGKRTAFIIGPSAFGYPKRSSSQVFETTLWCKPCSKDGRGKCINQIYKKCLLEVHPKQLESF